METWTRAQIGALGESLAADLLTSQGMRILARNWRCRYGEIDLIVPSAFLRWLQPGQKLQFAVDETGSTYDAAVLRAVKKLPYGGRFTLDGRPYTLAANNSPGGIPCHLHGGPLGFDKLLWQAEPTTHLGLPALRLTLDSRDGDEGYPGNLRVSVLYSITADRAQIGRAHV